MFCDNELATWLYVNLESLAINPLRSFASSLTEKIIPVAHARAKRESDGNFALEVVGRPWKNKTHSHIFDAGRSATKDLSKATRDEVISRFLRLVHPINHFLFPNDLNVAAEQQVYFGHKYNPNFQYVAAVYMKTRLPDVFESFLKRTNPGIYFKWPKNWEEIGNSEYNTLMMPSENTPTLEAPIEGCLRDLREQFGPPLGQSYDCPPNPPMTPIDSKISTAAIDYSQLPLILREKFGRPDVPPKNFPNLHIDNLQTVNIINMGGEMPNSTLHIHVNRNENLCIQGFGTSYTGLDGQNLFNVCLHFPTGEDLTFQHFSISDIGPRLSPQGSDMRNDNYHITNLATYRDGELDFKKQRSFFDALKKAFVAGGTSGSGPANLKISFNGQDSFKPSRPAAA
ncbi:MAG: hypothetical protein IPK04_15850 [Bdellovibrionales bacterium]|nr:hypothetical protein [Bdellovibrionales bacterium]